MAVTGVKIFEFYNRGDEPNSIYANDYIELYNTNNFAVDLSGSSLQYADLNNSARAFNLSGIIPANGKFLIRMGDIGIDGTNPLPTADFATSTQLNSFCGRIALVRDQVNAGDLGPQTSTVEDYVAFDSFGILDSKYYEGTGTAPAGTVTRSVSRKSLVDGGDTNQNQADFARTAPNPENTSAPPVCFTSGTSICTLRGEVAVEALAIGDIVVTASGAHRPIKWIGHRTLTCHGRKEAMPVRIAEGAFGEGRPRRDLTVSPAHAIAVDILGEVLIPACRLINGTTVTQVNAKEVSYWHVELDSHDILLAEGLPAESYLDCGNRRFFANADATDLAALPDARPEGPLPFCRPFLEAGPLVDLVRARLQDRAEALGWRKVEEAFAGMHLVADGRTIHPDTEDLTARFVLPADARDVRLVSAVSAPAYVTPGSTDDRWLGVALAALTIDDGLAAARSIALDDTRLGEGFYTFDGSARWTDGSAVLPADLWAGSRGTVFLRIRLSGEALPRWVRPNGTAEPVGLAEQLRRT